MGPSIIVPTLGQTGIPSVNPTATPTNSPSSPSIAPSNSPTPNSTTREDNSNRTNRTSTPVSPRGRGPVGYVSLGLVAFFAAGSLLVLANRLRGTQPSESDIEEMSDLNEGSDGPD